jgi:hypothetical protein
MNCDDQTRPPLKQKEETAREKKDESGKPEMDAITTQAGEKAWGGEQPRLPEEIQNKIGEQLRALYNQVAEEPVPEHLLQLLKRLEAEE